MILDEEDLAYHTYHVGGTEVVGASGMHRLRVQTPDSSRHFAAVVSFTEPIMPDAKAVPIGTTVFCA